MYILSDNLYLTGSITNITTGKIYELNGKTKQNMTNLNFFEYLSMKLEQNSIFDCQVFLSSDDQENLVGTVGLVVPGQLILVPVSVALPKKFTIIIKYTTIMKEMIKHTICFENGIEDEASFQKMEDV